MKIKCIDNEFVEGSLKINNIYEPLEPVKQDDKFYIIQLSKGTKGTFSKSRFERVED